MAMLVQQSYSKKYKYKYNYNNKFKLKHRWPARISAAEFLPKVKLPRFHFAVVSNFLISDSHCFQPRQNTLILFGSKISPFDVIRLTGSQLLTKGGFLQFQPFTQLAAATFRLRKLISWKSFSSNNICQCHTSNNHSGLSWPREFRFPLQRFSLTSLTCDFTSFLYNYVD